MWRVVIIDDDRHIVRSMKKMIPWAELNAACVGEGYDGEQGLEVISNTNPHIVITDVYMPVMNGLEMVGKLRELRFEGKTIILSGYSDFEYARQALRLNVDDYLSKPARLQTIRAVLEKAISSLEEEKKKREEERQLKEKLRHFEPFVQRQSLLALLTGLEEDEYFHPDSLRRFRQLDGRAHVVAGIEIVRSERMEKATVSDWSLYRFALGNIIEEVLQEDWPEAKRVQLYSRHMALWLPTASTEVSVDALRKQVRDLACRILECSAKYLDMHLHIGIGTVKQDWRQIPDSTEEAFFSLALKKVPVRSGVSLFEFRAGGSNEHVDSALRMRPIRFYQQLAEAVCHARDQLALSLIDRHLESLLAHEEISSTSVRRFGMEIWTICSYTLYENGKNLDHMYPPESIHAELEQLVDLHQLREWLREKVKGICTGTKNYGNIRHKQAVDYVIESVHRRYATDISLGELAREIYMSRNYLSNIFRQVTGESFNGYLTRVRMEKARELLLEGKWLIYEVAERVGYKNVPYFSTLFKKYTGMNPSDLIRQPLADQSPRVVQAPE